MGLCVGGGGVATVKTMSSTTKRPPLPAPKDATRDTCTEPSNNYQFLILLPANQAMLRHILTPETALRYLTSNSSRYPDNSRNHAPVQRATTPKFHKYAKPKQLQQKRRHQQTDRLTDRQTERQTDRQTLMDEDLQTQSLINTIVKEKHYI